MRDLLRKSCASALAFASLVFTFIPDTIFEKIKVIDEKIFGNIECLAKYSTDLSAMLNRIILFIVSYALATFVYWLYMLINRKNVIKGDNYEIVIRYGNLLKMKRCKKVINFDECFTTKIGILPEEIKETSICGQYLMSNQGIDIDSLIKAAGVSPMESTSKFKGALRYESGILVPNGEYLLMPFAKLNENGKGEMHRSEYLDCLNRLWQQINLHYGQKNVCIPILGAGLTNMDGASGASISQQELLNMIVWSYRLSSHKIKLPNKLIIVCKKTNDFSIYRVS